MIESESARGVATPATDQNNQTSQDSTSTIVGVAPEEDVPVTRAEIAALLSTLVEGEPLPSWVRLPWTEAQFAAALLAHEDFPGTPVFDDQDRLVAWSGVRLRGGAS